MTPPRLAMLLLQHLLPATLREPILGDLEEEWHAHPRPSAPHFWHLALRSIGACWIERVRDGVWRGGHVGFRRTGDGPMHSLLQDARYGLRVMRRNPGFTVTAVLTLAIGIGVNSAIFSIVNVLSLKPLPYRDPARVAFVLGWNVEANEMRFNLRRADFLDLQRQATSFEALSAYSYVSANLTGGDIPDRVQAYRVTPNTFSLLGVPAAIGRTFDDGDAGVGRLDLVVISHGLWQRRFGSDPSIVGRQLVVNGHPYHVAGVMPPAFEFPVFNFKGDLWLPWQARDWERGQPGATDGTTIVARLRAGVSYAQAQAELDTIMHALAARYPDTNRNVGARAIEIGRLDDEQARPLLLLLLVSVATVLMLACANVANLLLARGVSRRGELAVRTAVGASGLRIGRQLLVEGVLLGVAGGTVGLLFAVAALAGVRASLPEMLVTTVPNISMLGIDSTTLGHTLVTSLLISVIFGTLPAWRASTELSAGALKESASTGGSRSTRRLRTLLVIGEVALATILLVTAGLLVRSYDGLQRVDPGFEPANVMTMALTLPDYKYEDVAARRSFYEQLIERVERLPGVEAAALVNVLPFSTYDRGTRITVDGAPASEPGREPVVSFRIASLRYPETLHIPVLAGRFFDHADTAVGRPVAVVNRTAVERYLGGCGHPERRASCGASAIGRRIRIGDPADPWLTIVGVIGDVRHSSITREPQPEVYVPLAQSPAAMMMLAVRSAGRAADMAAPVRAAVQAIDPGQPVYHVKTLETLVGDALLPSRTSAATMALFGLLALVLAGVGIYGVVSYEVNQHTREFGVRLALGATPGDLLRQVLRGGALMIGSGVLIGLVGAAGVTRLLGSALHGVSPHDPATYAAIAAVLASIGVLACAVPARRASMTGPVDALRGQ